MKEVWYIYLIAASSLSPNQIEQKDIEQDKKIMLIFDFIKKLENRKKEEEEFQKRKRVGFKPGK